VGTWCKGEGPEGHDVCQAAACVAASWAMHCNDDEDIIAGHAAAV